MCATNVGESGVLLEICRRGASAMVKLPSNLNQKMSNWSGSVRPRDKFFFLVSIQPFEGYSNQAWIFSLFCLCIWALKRVNQQITLNSNGHSNYLPIFGIQSQQTCTATLLTGGSFPKPPACRYHFSCVSEYIKFFNETSNTFLVNLLSLIFNVYFFLYSIDPKTGHPNTEFIPMPDLFVFGIQMVVTLEYKHYGAI